ncbi:MAG: stage III sporulation protein AB [Ruminococcus sp.]|nr:stage III sporulation protein AB [Ruminococcus sp.]
MLLRVSAALMITGAGALIGVKQAEKLRNAREVSRQTSELMRRSCGLLRCQALNVYQLAGALKCSETLDKLSFLSDVPTVYRQGSDFHSHWREAVSGQDCLMDEERGLLLRFGEILGTTDIEGQVSAISALLSEADVLTLRRSEEYAHRGRLCRSIWTLFGLMAGILVI